MNSGYKEKSKREELGDVIIDPDRELVARLQEELGSERQDAFNELYSKYENLVYRACLKLIGNPEDASEVCEDVLLKIRRKIDQFEGRAKLKTWVFRIIRNTCSTKNKKLAIERERREVIEKGSYANMQEGRITEGLEDFELVYEALGCLDAGDKEILELRFFNDFTLQEIAEKIGMELSAAKNKLYRARDRFKKVYKVKEEEGRECS